MTSTGTTESIHPGISFYEDPGRHRGILGWILTLDHKRIGVLYFIFVMAFFFSGIVLGFFYASGDDRSRRRHHEAPDL
ncbi:MAG: hypothetical protein MUP41_20990 [Desulfobacterales bacterium]|nr:hypothetical protein [Desulfobacterales bacterium]